MVEGHLTMMTPPLIRRSRKTRHARRIPVQKSRRQRRQLRIALSRHEFIIPFAIVMGTSTRLGKHGRVTRNATVQADEC